MYPSHLIIASDPPMTEPDLQSHLLDVVCAGTKTAFRSIVMPETAQGPCEWRGFTCSGGKLSQVAFCYWYEMMGDFAIAFLPNSTQYIGIEGCQLGHAIHTRYLPRRSRYIKLRDNAITGTLVCALPVHLICLHISMNALSGKVQLTNLPPMLEALQLFDNDFVQKTVYFANIPTTAVEVRFENRAFAVKPKFVRVGQGSQKHAEASFFSERVWMCPPEFESVAYWESVYV